MTRGDRIIAISDFIARHIRDTYGVAADRIATIHRGIDTVRFDPEQVSGERMVRLANEWRLPDGVPVVMMPAGFRGGRAPGVRRRAGRGLGARTCAA